MERESLRHRPCCSRSLSDGRRKGLYWYIAAATDAYISYNSPRSRICRSKSKPNPTCKEGNSHNNTCHYFWLVASILLRFALFQVDDAKKFAYGSSRPKISVNCSSCCFANYIYEVISPHLAVVLEIEGVVLERLRFRSQRFLARPPEDRRQSTGFRTVWHRTCHNPLMALAIHFPRL